MLEPALRGRHTRGHGQFWSRGSYLEKGINQRVVANSGKQRLLDAASELFADYGVDEVTVAQILDVSGVKAPTLYHHFGGKEGLYVSWAVLTLGRIRHEVAEIEPNGQPLERYLESVATCLLSNKGIDLSQVLRDRSRLASPESENQIERAIDSAIVKPLVRAISGTSQTADPRCAAQLFLHLVTGSRGRYRLSGLERQPCIEAVVHLFLNGLRGEVAPKALVD